MNHKFNKENMVLIDLSKHKSSSFKDLLKDNGFDGKICPNALSKFKADGYLKLWVDSTTFELISFTHKSSRREIQFNIEFISYMKSLKALSIKEKSINYDIDMILDKISIDGIKSLTPNEIDFLNNYK